MANPVVRAAVLAVPDVAPHLNAQAWGEMAGGGELAAVSAAYHDAITQALVGFFENGGQGYRNAFKRAMVSAFGSAVDSGWVDGGGTPPIDADLLQWFNERVSQELGFIDDLFAQAKQLRKDPAFDYFTWITARADAYTQTVASIYNAARLFASKSQMLTWRLGATEKHCATCAKLDGVRHRASWFLARDYIPHKPGAALDCGGYNCDCRLETDAGEEVTI